MSSDKMQALFAMLVGFGVGCAVISIGGGQPAVAPVNMAALGPARSPVKFLQPSAARYSTHLTRATPESSTDRVERREMLNALAFAAAAAVVQEASALSPIDVKDKRKVRETGFDLIYEARDSELPQNVRDGLTQARASLSDTKTRVLADKKIIDTELLPLIKKAYWTQAKEKLRLELGDLRFDLGTLASAKAKDEKKAAVAANKEFFTKAEKCDFAIRSKNMDAAEKAFAAAAASLDALVKSY
jgi:photosystem II oxygen-evolving enhancer protein 3